jgi:V-type H+-transporting ATPase proteolipid subunit
VKAGSYSLTQGAIHMGAGVSVGFAGLVGGWAIGKVGFAGVKSYAQEPRVFVGMVLILIFSEVLALYGLIVSLLLKTKASSAVCT